MSIQGIMDYLNKLSEWVEPWQLVLGAAILLVLAIVLIIALASRNRKFDNLSDEKEKTDLAVERAAREKEKLLQEKEAAVAQVRAEGDRVIEAKEEQIGAKDSTIGQLETKVDELSKFRDEYIAIPNARVEAGRIIREAKDHAFVVSNRTEMEYAEIIDHANHEAESIRSLAQERLQRSHEALKAALSRANEIVEEAHGSALQISQGSVAYMSAPSLIEAPAVEEVSELENELAEEAEAVTEDAAEETSEE